MHTLGHIPPLQHANPARPLRRALLAFATLAALALMGVAAAATIDLAAVGAALQGADPDLMALAVLLYAACQTVSGVQWWVIQRAGGVDGLGAGHTLGLHWISRGACEALPASLGEGVRVAVVRRHPAGARAGTWRIVGALGGYKLVDGVVTSAAVLAIVMITPPPGPAGDVRWMALAALAMAVAAGVALRRGRLGALRRRIPARVASAVSRMAEGGRGITEPSAARMATMLSLVAVLLRVLSIAALLAALGLPVEAAALVYALIVVSGLIPLAPGGAGTREAVLIPALALAHGVPAASAMALSVAIQAVSLGTSLALGGGALAWLGPMLMRCPEASADEAVLAAPAPVPDTV